MNSLLPFSSFLILSGIIVEYPCEDKVRRIQFSLLVETTLFNCWINSLLFFVSETGYGNLCGESVRITLRAPHLLFVNLDMADASRYDEFPLAARAMEITNTGYLSTGNTDIMVMLLYYTGKRFN
jgi:hypothetical protein